MHTHITDSNHRFLNFTQDLIMHKRLIIWILYVDTCNVIVPALHVYAIFKEFYQVNACLLTTWWLLVTVPTQSHPQQLSLHLEEASCSAQCQRPPSWVATVHQIVGVPLVDHGHVITRAWLKTSYIHWTMNNFPLEKRQANHPLHRMCIIHYQHAH